MNDPKSRDLAVAGAEGATAPETLRHPGPQKCRTLESELDARGLIGPGGKVPPKG